MKRTLLLRWRIGSAPPHWVLMLSLIANCGLASGGEQKIGTIDLGGRVVTNAVVTSETPVEVVVMWDGGGKIFKRADLPISLKDLYPYDPAKSAAYLKKQDAEREKRLEQVEAKQRRASQELKSTLLGQRVSLKQRTAALEKEVAQVHNQIDNRRPRMRRRLTPAEQADQERLTRRQSELQDQVDDLNAKIAAIDVRIGGIP